MSRPPLLLLAAALLGLAACKPHPGGTFDDTRVRFQGAAFSIKPGRDWLRVDTTRLSRQIPNVVVCQPVLQGSIGMIQVVQLGDLLREDQAIATITRVFDEDERAEKESLAHWEFQSVSGHRVMAFQYARHAPEDRSKILHYLSNFVVRTTPGRWISFGVRTANLEEAKQIEEMIRTTLEEHAPITPTPRPAS